MSWGWFRTSSCSRTRRQPTDGWRTNHQCVMQLTNGDLSALGRVLDLDLASRGLQRRLSEHLGTAGIEDPVAWTRDIVLDRKNWDLSFDKWEFTSEIAPERVTFVRVATDLPVVTDEQQDDDRLVDLIGQQVLTPRERRKMGVVFEVAPHPGQVRGLAYFTVQVVSKDAGPVGATRKVKVWKVARAHTTVSLPKLNNVDFEEGWHHVRVQPWTADGDPIPIAEPVAQTGKRPNESEPFYVLPDADLGADPPQRSVPKADSIEHARLERQFTALLQNRETSDIAPHSVGWTQRSTRSRAAAQETIEVKFGKEGASQISVARWLKNIEQRILEMPERPVSWRMQLHAGQPQSPTADIDEWTTTTAVRGFLDARSAYFRCVRQETGDMVSQGLDLLRNAPLVIAYAVAYIDVVKDLARQSRPHDGSRPTEPDRFAAGSAGGGHGAARDRGLPRPAERGRDDRAYPPATRALAARVGSARSRLGTEGCHGAERTRDTGEIRAASRTVVGQLPVHAAGERRPRVYRGRQHPPVLAALCACRRRRPARAAGRCMCGPRRAGACNRGRRNHRPRVGIAHRALPDPASLRTNADRQRFQRGTRQRTGRCPGRPATAGGVQRPALRRAPVRT